MGFFVPVVHFGAGQQEGESPGHPHAWFISSDHRAFSKGLVNAIPLGTLQQQLCAVCSAVHNED